MPRAAVLVFTIACVAAACDTEGSGICLPGLTAIPGTLEAECMESIAGGVTLEARSTAAGKRAIHIGSNTDEPTDGMGDAVVYRVDIPWDVEAGVLEVIYSDEVAGNVLDVTWDDVKRGRMVTDTTASWNAFSLSVNKTLLGPLTTGTHRLRLEVVLGGSWGVRLDQLRVIEVPAANRIPRAYAFVRELVNPATGLCRSALYDPEFTNLYKNALAAMAFVHEGDTALAEGIFDFFVTRFDATNFSGFTKSWSHNSGDELENNHTETDNAFLLLALNYYASTAGGYGRFQPLADGLVAWLLSRAATDVVASVAVEAVANMYAALKPFEATVAGVPDAMTALHEAFTARADYANVADHIVRGALVFSDTAGFAMVESLARTEIAEANGVEVRGVAAASNEDFANVEISAQLRLAAHIWGQDLVFLDQSLNELWLGTGLGPDVVTEGLPYTVTTHFWERSADAAILDPTCFMLFHEWSFNPWAPGQQGFQLTR